MKTKAQRFRLWLLPEVEERIRHYTSLAAGEVSGLGLVEEVDGGFLVTRVFLPRQQCTHGGTELDQKSIAEILVGLEDEGIDSGTLKFWFHSHGNLDVFWSSTDEDCIAGLANDNYFVSLVVNKAGDSLSRLDLFRPVRVTIDNVPIGIRGHDLGLLEVCKAEVEENVTEINLRAHISDLRSGPRFFEREWPMSSDIELRPQTSDFRCADCNIDLKPQTSDLRCVECNGEDFFDWE